MKWPKIRKSNQINGAIKWPPFSKRVLWSAIAICAALVFSIFGPRLFFRVWIGNVDSDEELRNIAPRLFTSDEPVSTHMTVTVDWASERLEVDAISVDPPDLIIGTREIEGDRLLRKAIDLILSAALIDGKVRVFGYGLENSWLNQTVLTFVDVEESALLRFVGKGAEKYSMDTLIRSFESVYTKRLRNPDDGWIVADGAGAFGIARVGSKDKISVIIVWERPGGELYRLDDRIPEEAQSVEVMKKLLPFIRGFPKGEVHEIKRHN